MKIEDILAPYQYDAQNPPELIEAFDAELNWFGIKRQAIIGRFIVRPDSSNFYTFWRLEGDDGAWCLLEAVGAHRVEKIWDEEEATPEKLLQRIRSLIGKGAFCRLFFLPKIEKYVCVTFSSGTFYDWIDRPSISFHFHENKLKSQLCSKTKQIFESVIADENSDAAFAFRLLNCTGSIFRALIFDFADAEAYERASKIAERLITLVLWSSEIQWIPDEHHRIHVPIQQRNISIRNSAHDPVAGRLTRQGHCWIKLIKHFGPLQINDEHRKRHRAVENFGTLLSFKVWPPSAHERIEAQHEFLEWAKIHLPPEKYAEVEALES